MNTETKQNQISDNKKPSIEYMNYNEVEAKVAKEKSKLDATREKICNSIEKNSTIIKGDGYLNPLARIIKDDKGFKIITLRVGTKPIHKLVVDGKFKDLDILDDLMSKVKKGDFDAMIKEYCQTTKKKTKSPTDKFKSPELNINYSNASEMTSKK